MASASDRPESLAPGRLGVYAEGLLSGAELPMFSARMIELLGLELEKPTAARRLFELVAEDYALACNVLRLANSFQYNRSNRAVESLSLAIVMLGAATVRNIASTLVCTQASGPSSATLQRLMNRSIVSAHVALALADDLNVDRESAYLSGMLQNMGEVLVAHRSPVDHKAIQEQVKAGTPREAAAVKQLTFTYDHLARVVGRYWKLSPTVCALWHPDLAATDLMRLARFASELSRVMFETEAERLDNAITLLVMRHGATFGLTVESLRDVWAQAVGETRAMFETVGMPTSPLDFAA